jgi:hypothetical protein
MRKWTSTKSRWTYPAASAASSTPKRKFYLAALGSAHECAAIIDLLRASGQVNEDTCAAEKERASRIVEMLTKLACAMERRAERGEWKG